MKKLFNFIFTICILNATFISCKSSEMLSVDEASEMEKEEESLVLHTPNKKYTLANYSFSDNKLVGDLKNKMEHKGSTIHVHTKQSFSIELKEHESQYFELSTLNIEKMTYSKDSTGKTVLLVPLVALGVLIIVRLPYMFGGMGM